MKRKVIIDIEANGLLLDVTTIWVIVCKDIDTNEVFVFTDYFEFHKFSLEVDTWIGHNILGYDAPAINKLTLSFIPYDECIDTLILSKIFRPKREKGHSLKSWGERLGFNKIEFNDWSKLTPEMIEYCKQDVELTHRVYNYLRQRYTKTWDTFKDAIDLEHKMAYISTDMTLNGFGFDVDKAKNLWYNVVIELEKIDEQIHRAFGVKVVPYGEPTKVRRTKKGTISRQGMGWYPENIDTDFSDDCYYQRIEYVVFNPDSPKQVIERLNELGWKPTEKTDGHKEAERAKDKEALRHYQTYGWKVSEKNLATLPDDAPEGAKLLIKRLVFSTRKRRLEEWLGLYNEKTKSIHGSFDPLGTWTHRGTHSKPNMANVAAKKSIKYNTKEISDLVMYYGEQMRSLWIPNEDECYLVGTDAEGIQLRILAHYMDDEEFRFALIHGKKEDGTDPHTLNMKKLGKNCKSRDNAKTFIYAYLLGAQKGKVSEILNCSAPEAIEAMINFEEGYPGLKRLKQEDIPNDAARGYFVGLDGRLVACEEERLILAGYLQEGESTVMKKANVIWREELERQRIPYKQVNWVHDEYVTQVYSEEDAKLVGKIQCEAITRAGELLNVRCPLSGSTAYGKNWYEIH